MIARSSHGDRLLLVRIGVRTDTVAWIWLLHLNLLLSHLWSESVVSSSLGDTEFAEDEGEDDCSSEHAPLKDLVVSFSLMSSLLLLFFS